MKEPTRIPMIEVFKPYVKGNYVMVPLPMQGSPSQALPPGPFSDPKQLEKALERVPESALIPFFRAAG